ncbi:hypothetical protein D3C72_1472160 [compost metagenome]
MGLVRRIGRAFALDQPPVGAPGPGHVHARRAHGDQTLGGDGGNPRPRFLDDDRRVQITDQGLKRGADAPPIAVALGLTGFLQGVQMHHQGVRPDHVQRPSGLLDPKPLRQLGRADIGQDRRVGRPVA